VRERGRAVCRVRLQPPGPINARNALGVMLIAAEVGVGWEEAAAALADFRGVRRRQEVVGEAKGVTVIDDFAHHPTAVAETLAALRSQYGGGALWAVFEPRSATACRAIHQEMYGRAFSAADRVILVTSGAVFCAYAGLFNARRHVVVRRRKLCAFNRLGATARRSAMGETLRKLRGTRTIPELSTSS